MNQKTQLIHYMRKQYCTPLLALHLCGCLNFGARINEIGKMYDLHSKWVTTDTKKRVKAFKIKGIK